MGSIPDNHYTWTNYDWPKQGDEWSGAWGATDSMWWGSIFPRIMARVPAQTILEIAPGFGRCTQYLRALAQRLMIVDLTPRCIEHCRERFADSRHIEYFVNDGKSLAMIPDASVDFVFSWDSLVHVEAEVMEAYLSQLARKLKPDGVGFIHHSNIGVYVEPRSGRLPFENTHWRGESMTAQHFAEYCARVGLQCLSQEIIDWNQGVLNDSFSMFTRADSRLAHPNQIRENPAFMEEAAHFKQLAKLYPPRRGETPRQGAWPVLDELYRTRRAPDLQGTVHEVEAAGVTRQTGEGLHALIRQLQPQQTLEIGCGYGCATLPILQALLENGHGRHIAVDPAQTTRWSSIGLANVRRAGLSNGFQLEEASAPVALPQLLAQGLQVDFAFVDGAYPFDELLVDWYYLDKLLVDGGLIIFDNWTTLPAVLAVTNFVEANMAYAVAPISEALPLRALRKTHTAARPWNHFVPFEADLRPHLFIPEGTAHARP